MGDRLPDAVLSVFGARAFVGDRLFRLEDLDGDGLREGIAVVELSSSPRFILIWKGVGRTFGMRSPDAQLLATGLGSLTGNLDDELGSGYAGAIQFGDVTGDGHKDVIAGVPLADYPYMRDVGVVYVWSGAPGFTGFLAESAYLAVPGQGQDDRLAMAGAGDGFFPARRDRR